MKILSEKQLPSGDWELDCEFADEEVHLLINYAFNRILKEQIEKMKEEDHE